MIIYFQYLVNFKLFTEFIHFFLEVEIFKIYKLCFEEEMKIRSIFEELDKEKKGFFFKRENFLKYIRKIKTNTIQIFIIRKV